MADLLRPFLLEGRSVLITGGTGGIGQACVRRLHDYGATVATTFLPVRETVATVADTFPGLDRVTAHPLDLRDTSILATGMSQALHGAVIDTSMGLGVRPGMMG